MKIHFICRGNVFRSLIAETYLKSLNIESLEVMSSGTNVDLTSQTERGYFNNTIALLRKHHINQFSKKSPVQLTQDRANNIDLTICLNNRVYDEAINIVNLPADTSCWDIDDIGEGHRVDTNNTSNYEEDIYQEIVTKVNQLVKELVS